MRSDDDDADDDDGDQHSAGGSAGAAAGMRAHLNLLGRSLFLRIFVCFWLAMGLIVAVGMAITGLVAASRYNALDGIEPAALVGQADAALARGGLAALRDWIDRSEDDYPTLKVYVVDHNVRDILGRRLQARIDDRLGAHIAEHDFAVASGAAALPAPGANGRPVSWWDIHDMTAPDGTAYVLGFLPFDPPHLEALRHADIPLFLLIAAFAMSAPVCWWLARYISRPVRQLELGAQALGDGDFGVRIDAALLGRNDEFGALARAFGDMAENVADHVQSKENLLRDVSHELRSPLARLRLALELARRPAANVAAQFDRIEQECAHLDAMVGQLLHLARLRNAPTEMPAPLDLADVVQQVVADARFEAGGVARQVDWQRPAAPLPVLGVPLLLRSALENMIRNALRYAPPGSAVLVTAWRDDSGVVVEIGDHGSGVAEADLALLFQPFFRAGPAETHSPSGAGLGLTIAAAIIDQHGGSIVARNRAGAAGETGLIVRTTLPVL